jgi:predicted nuclease of predicted toxin-antitoxin system
LRGLLHWGARQGAALSRLDAQLPPSLGAWLASNHDVSAVAIRDLGLRDAEDRAILDEERARREVDIVSKDSDFADLVARFGAPPQVL